MQAPYPDVPQAVSPFPTPPEFSKNYTIERIKMNSAPAPPPVQNDFTVFGEEYRLDDDIIRPLSVQKITQLYPSNKFDWKTEMKKLNKSAVAAFLDLLEILIRNPEHQDRLDKLEDIRTIFINMHHLINEFRPLQARLTLQAMQHDQIGGLEEIIRNFKTFLSGGKSALRSTLGMEQIELLPMPPKPDWFEEASDEGESTSKAESNAFETLTKNFHEVNLAPRPTRSELLEKKLLDQKFIDSMQ